MKKIKKLLIYVLSLTMFLSVTTGCGSNIEETAITGEIQESGPSKEIVTKSSSNKIPKYIFMFIGDGMSFVQLGAAQVYEGKNIIGEVEPSLLNFSKFPATGIATTQDSTSFIPDSASTASALSTGVKTHSGVLGLEVDKRTVAPSIAKLLKEQKNMKIGIISNVTINHATPAAYYLGIKKIKRMPMKY